MIVEAIVWSCSVKCSDLLKWISLDMLRNFSSSFSKLLSNLADHENVEDEIVSGVVHRIASIYGALLLVQGNQISRSWFRGKLQTSNLYSKVGLGPTLYIENNS